MMGPKWLGRNPVFIYTNFTIIDIAVVTWLTEEE